MPPTKKKSLPKSSELSPAAGVRTGHERRGPQTVVPRQPVLRPRPRADGRDAQRRLHRAGPDRPRPRAQAGRADHGNLRRAGRAGGGLPLGRVPARPAPGQQPAQPRHHRAGPPGDDGTGPEPRRPDRAGGGARAWATAAWAGWPPATWIRWPRSKCPPSATASATSSASSTRPSRTAGRWRSPTSGCASATRGRSPGPRSPTR